MRPMFVAILAALALGGVVLPAAGSIAPVVAAPTAVPKVVLIVGPAGRATGRYRAQARKAAALARRYTPDVTELYSPDATWSAVKAALQGASLVVYMGHGNGWPSKYRNHLYPPTQNGFGLNPEAGGDDGTHQYFGEGPIARHIRLADDAVVLLNHLCYASGNSEPGLPEGSLEQARQRVDNFAAGFIKAGAAAVVAEAYASPNHMLRAVLAGSRSIDAAWQRAPSRNGNAFAFESARSPGFIAQMDPESATAGFTRSIVLKADLTPADVLRWARGSTAGAAAIDPLALAPSLTAAGIAAATPTLKATTAASEIEYTLPITIAHPKSMPKAILASARWDPLDAPAVVPPDLGLVTPERLGDVVAPVKVRLAEASLAFGLTSPIVPGRYRLTVTLHDADGVAFDAATQALLPTLIVRVTGDIDAEIVVPDALELAPGDAPTLPVWVANLGAAPWGHAAPFDPIDRNGGQRGEAARLVGQWVALDLTDPDQVASAAAAAVTATHLPAGMEPGAAVQVDLPLFAPVVPGDYLLVLDIVSPDQGSLTAIGVEATTVRVRVVGPARSGGS